MKKVASGSSGLQTFKKRKTGTASKKSAELMRMNNGYNEGAEENKEAGSSLEDSQTTLSKEDILN